MNYPTQSVTTYYKQEDGAEVVVIVKVKADHYKDWVKWLKRYQESPIVWGMKEI